MWRRAFFLSLMLGLLGGCAGKVDDNSGRYAMKHDRYPDRPADVSDVPDAVPRVEPISRGGNKSPYRVLGKNYHVLASASGYRERGTASWYGEKFHGHKTSNGEVYDMYKMSAAHKSLPLPTYARITNLDNGRQVIVRVNDRGPFHGNRLIDLSYAAAARLDMLKHGTARVEVEAIDPLTWNSRSVVANATQTSTSAPVPESPVPETSVAGRFLQVGAYSSEAAAQRVVAGLGAAALAEPAMVRAVERGGRTLYRVLVGPLRGAADDLVSQVQAAGHPSPILVNYP
ncbi:septal ring lytic transglycosylase RlpA family protein [Marinobacterium litorale]|uniref:septal ring lytic transglycosylase RlpA family protein n=1 Tax=Marinobacterium litorale TaxID=404770 RepID=UPI0003FBE989|nr:septal ring lytic transglycosylase RlpA family protein [Marinobacterium litorale]